MRVVSPSAGLTARFRSRAERSDRKGYENFSQRRGDRPPNAWRYLLSLAAGRFFCKIMRTRIADEVRSTFEVAKRFPAWLSPIPHDLPGGLIGVPRWVAA